MRGTASYRTSYGVDLPYRAWTTPDVIFSVIDVDGSGQLSIDELRKFFKKSPLDPAKMETMFTLMDVDGSGEISREEWRAGFHAAGFDGSGVVGQSAEGFDTLLALVKPNYAVTQLLGDLHGGRAPNLVTRPEYRGVTLHQLRQLWKHVNKRCVKEGWMDVDGELIEPNTITMYELMRYIIKPLTQYSTGTCSYVERCSETVVQPSWTVLHWWGDSFRDLMLCLEQHAKDRGISDEAASYWMAAFALDQHETSPIEMSDAARHAVPRAIAISVGTLLCLDRRGLGFRRLWILYELYLSLTVQHRGHPKMLDVYAPLTHLCKRRLPAPPFEVHAVGLTEGFCMVDRGHGPKGEGEAFNKTERERHFPTSLLEAGLDASVAAAHTSVEHDTRALHAHLASTHVPQDVVEGAVRGRFAVAALRKALDETPYDGGTFFRRCLHALSASPLTHVSAHFSGCVSFDPTLGAAFAQALPPTLESLSVHFSDVDEKAAEAFVKALAALIQSPSELRYQGKLPRLHSLTLVSNVLGADGGYALSVALGAKGPRKFKMLDLGLPAPFEHRTASAIVAVRSPRWLSYFGEGRFVTEGGGGGVIKGGAVVSLPSQRLTSSDLILLLATAARGNPHPLLALDVSDNELDEEGVRLLESMISDGQLPGLEVVDLSDNAGVPESCKKGVFNAMKMTQGQRVGHDFVLSAERPFRIEPAPPEEEDASPSRRHSKEAHSRRASKA